MQQCSGHLRSSPLSVMVVAFDQPYVRNKIEEWGWKKKMKPHMLYHAVHEGSRGTSVKFRVLLSYDVCEDNVRWLGKVYKDILYLQRKHAT